MKFKYVKEVEGTVNNYDGTKIATGDVFELNDLMSKKALRNPQYELVKEPTITIPKTVAKPVLVQTKRKPMSDAHKAKMAEGRAKAKLDKANGNKG